jgi:hypothetical protein
MTPLSPDALEMDGALRGLAAGEVMALPIAYAPGNASERARLLDQFGRIVAELRDAGWSLDTHVRRPPNGEVFAIEPTGPPPPAPALPTSQED